MRVNKTKKVIMSAEEVKEEGEEEENIVNIIYT